jgi:hypothetical protein
MYGPFRARATRFPLALLVAACLSACSSSSSQDSGFLGSWVGSGPASGSCDDGSTLSGTQTFNGTFVAGSSGEITWRGVNCTFFATVSGDVATATLPATCAVPDANGGTDTDSFSPLTWTLTGSSITVNFSFQEQIGGTGVTCTITGSSVLTKQ